MVELAVVIRCAARDGAACRGLGRNGVPPVRAVSVGINTGAKNGKADAIRGTEKEIRLGRMMAIRGAKAIDTLADVTEIRDDIPRGTLGGHMTREETSDGNQCN